MRKSILGLVLCTGAIGIASVSEAQPAPPPPQPQQPPVAQPQPPVAGQAQGQPQIITTTPDGQVVNGNGQPTTIIVVQGGGQTTPRKRRTLPAEEGQPPPQGYHAEQKMLKPLVIAGWSTFGAGYLLTLLGGVGVAVSNSCFLGSNCTHAANDSGWISFIPIAGPWIYVANGGFADASRIYFGFTGVLQVAGLGMAIAGHAAHMDVWVSDEAKNPYGPRIGIGPSNLTFTTNF